MTNTIPYTISAGGGGALTLMPVFNGGVYGSGVSGVSNVSSSPIFLDNIAVSVAAVPEPATLGILSLGGLLALRRRRSRC